MSLVKSSESANNKTFAVKPAVAAGEELGAEDRLAHPGGPEHEHPPLLPAPGPGQAHPAAVPGQLGKITMET